MLCNSGQAFLLCHTWRHVLWCQICCTGCIAQTTEFKREIQGMWVEVLSSCQKWPQFLSALAAPPPQTKTTTLKTSCPIAATAMSNYINTSTFPPIWKMSSSMAMHSVVQKTESTMALHMCMHQIKTVGSIYRLSHTTGCLAAITSIQWLLLFPSHNQF